MIARILILGLRNMRRHLRRTVLTTITFAIAVFLFTVLVAVPVSMDRIAADAARGLRLIVIAHNSYRLPAKYCNEIRRMPHVVGCAAEIQLTMTYRDPHDYITAIGATSDLFNIATPNDFQVPPEKRSEVFADRRNCSVGSVLMREHGWRLGQQIVLRDPSSTRITLTLIPVVELPTLLTARVLFFNRQVLDEQIKNNFGVDIADRATFLGVKVDSARNMDQVTAEIDENFHNSEAETETTDESDALSSVITDIGDVKTIMYSLSLVVLATVLLIAANSMAMMVRDRISEVATMRALGFNRIHVVALLLAEALLIGASGGVIGAGVALAAFHGGVGLGALTGGLGYMAVDPGTTSVAFLVAVAVAALSAAIPVANASRVAPATAFRKVV